MIPLTRYYKRLRECIEDAILSKRGFAEITRNIKRSGILRCHTSACKLSDYVALSDSLCLQNTLKIVFPTGTHNNQFHSRVVEGASTSLLKIKGEGVSYDSSPLYPYIRQIIVNTPKVLIQCGTPQHVISVLCIKFVRLHDDWGC